MQQMWRSRNGQAGFSLIELMVAMTVTLVITGAVYGLIAGGQNAFRREPELSERQQNIRIAIDVILRDIANAGSGMPPFVQTFTPNLDDCAAPCPIRPDVAGENTDELEILTNAALGDNEAVCRTDGNLRANGANDLQLVRGTTTITPGTSLVLVMDDGTWTVRSVTAVGVGVAPETNCLAANHALLTFASGDAINDPLGMNPAAATLCSPNALGMGTAAAGCDVMEVAYGEVVRYRTRVGADGIPVLQRQGSGNAAAGFQTIARGIDDLQVQYLTAAPAAAWVDDAPVVGLPAAANWASIITQVRVTISARSEAQNIQGARTSVAGPAAMRGMLTATASPRSSLIALTRADPVVAPPLWR